MFDFYAIMRITNIQPYTNTQKTSKQNNVPHFGQYVSRLGRSIDDVLRVNEPSSKSLSALYDELLNFVRSPKFLSKQKGEGHFSHVYNIDDKFYFPCEELARYGRNRCGQNHRTI